MSEIGLDAAALEGSSLSARGLFDRAAIELLEFVFDPDTREVGDGRERLVRDEGSSSPDVVGDAIGSA